MSALREAAQQALGYIREVDYGPWDKRELIKALEAALAPPEQAQEPVAWMVYTLDGESVCVTDNPADFTDEHKALPLYATPQPETAQEPVAWVYTGIKQDGTEHGPHLVWKPEYMDAMSASKGAKATPLYFAPPRQPEPAQEAEPYAWHYTNNAGASVWHRGPSSRLDADMQAARDYPRVHKVTPLYTAPLRRPPLTDEEIRDAVQEADLDWQAGWTLDEHEPNRFTTLVRAIERKVRGEA